VSGNPVQEATPHPRKNPAPGACPVSRQTRRGQVVSQVVSQVRAAWARSRMRSQPPTTEVLRVASSKTQSGAALQQEAPAEALGQLPSYPSRRCHQVELCRGLARQMAKHSGRKHRKRRYLACCTQEGAPLAHVHGLGSLRQTRGRTACVHRFLLRRWPRYASHMPPQCRQVKTTAELARLTCLHPPLALPPSARAAA
jgi:hypothetical protein